MNSATHTKHRMLRWPRELNVLQIEKKHLQIKKTTFYNNFTTHTLQMLTTQPNKEVMHYVSFALLFKYEQGLIVCF